MNTTAIGDSLEIEVLRQLQARPAYQAQRSVHTPLRRGSSDSDLIVSLRSSGVSYSILVECKNHRGRVNKGVVFELEQRRLRTSAQVALLVTTSGLARGASEMLPDFPNIAHFRIDDFTSSISSGSLDDLIPRLASRRSEYGESVATLSELLRSFDEIAAWMAISDGNSRAPDFYCQAGSELLRSRHLVFSQSKGVASGAEFTARTIAACSPDVRRFLLNVQSSHPTFIAHWMRIAKLAHEELLDLEWSRSGAILNWQRSIFRFSERAVRLSLALVCPNLKDASLPEFQHGGLDGVLTVLQSLPRIENLVARVLYQRLVAEESAAVKSAVALVGRRFMPFRLLVSDDLQISWSDLQHRALRSTVGTELERLDVRHDIAYCGAMFGACQEMREDIEAIESDRGRMQALVDMNLRIGRAHLPRLLAMLERKSVKPPTGEEFVKSWAGSVHRQVRAAAEARRLL